MTTSDSTSVADRTKGSPVRRAATAVILGLVLFVVLWTTAFHAVTSAIVASGGVVVLAAGSGSSESLQSLFDAVADVVLAVLGAIGDFLSSIFDFG